MARKAKKSAAVKMEAAADTVQQMKDVSGYAEATAKPIVLAEGEATGHHHVLSGDGVALLEETKDGKKVFTVGEKGGKVVHEEHKVVELPPGQYESYQVLEYNHDLEEARKVAD